MPFKSLGSRFISGYNDYTIFESFSYQPGSYYLGLINFEVANPEFVYSTFLLRLGYTLSDNPTATTPVIQSFEYSSTPIFFVFGLPRGIDGTREMTLQIKRVSKYANPSKLSEVRILLSVDTNQKLGGPL